MMGTDCDAAVIAAGHCGFGMGAAPNAMADMETLTGANGDCPRHSLRCRLWDPCSSILSTQPS